MNEFAALLKRTGMTRKALAEAMGIRASSVSKWAGQAPRYAMAYLRLRAAIRESEGEILKRADSI